MAIKVHANKSSYVAITKELNKSFKLPFFPLKNLRICQGLFLLNLNFFVNEVSLLIFLSKQLQSPHFLKIIVFGHKHAKIGPQKSQ